MTGRHRRPRRLSKEGRRLLGGAALLAVFAPVTVYTLNAAIAHVQSCATETTLTVAAAPELAGVLEEFVANGGGAPSRGSDVCADIAIEPVAGADIAESDADVWIPETALWLDIPDTGLDERWRVLDGSTATSAVGLAVPAGDEADDITPDSADVALRDPREHPCSLMWIAMFGVTEASVEDGPGDLRVMSAPDVIAHNEADGEPLQPPSGTTQIGVFEYPMLVAADIGDDRREAAVNLLRSYGSEQYPELLSAAGFGEGVPQTAEFAENAVPAALAAWDAYASSD